MSNNNILYRIGYHFREGLRAVSKNRLVNTGAVGLLITCLFFTGTLSLIVKNIDSMIAEIGSTNDISLFLDTSVTEDRISEYQQTVLSRNGVEKVEFISKEQALESLEEDFGNLLEGLKEDNPLRDELRVTISNQEDIDVIAAELAKIDGIENIVYNQDAALKIVNIRNTIFLIGIIVVGVLAVISILIISNSVRISIYTRSDEITIMRTIGAKSRFIRMPFVVEGLFLGLIGSGLAYLLTFLFYQYLWIPAFDKIIFINALPFSDFVWYLAVVYLVAGFFMGFFGSNIAINRYLKK